MTLLLIINDGDLDSWIDKAWDGRDIELIAGQQGIKLNEFGTVLKGTVSSINADDQRIMLRIKDPAAFLRLPLIT